MHERAHRNVQNMLLLYPTHLSMVGPWQRLRHDLNLRAQRVVRLRAAPPALESFPPEASSVAGRRPGTKRKPRPPEPVALTAKLDAMHQASRTHWIASGIRGTSLPIGPETHVSQFDTDEAQGCETTFGWRKQVTCTPTRPSVPSSFPSVPPCSYPTVFWRNDAQAYGALVEKQKQQKNMFAT